MPRTLLRHAAGPAAEAFEAAPPTWHPNWSSMSQVHLFRNDPATQTYAAGAPIFAQGDEGDTMFVVVEGRVALSVGERVVEHVEAGGLFGEMALIDHRARSASAVAERESKLVAVDQKRFLFLVKATPYFAIDVMSTMAERLRKMDAVTE